MAGPEACQKLLLFKERSSHGEVSDAIVFWSSQHQSLPKGADVGALRCRDTLNTLLSTSDTWKKVRLHAAQESCTAALSEACPMSFVMQLPSGPVPQSMKMQNVDVEMVKDFIIWVSTDSCSRTASRCLRYSAKKVFYQNIINPHQYPVRLRICRIERRQQ